MICLSPIELFFFSLLVVCWSTRASILLSCIACILTLRVDWQVNLFGIGIILDG
jgi:hypothetical protein